MSLSKINLLLYSSALTLPPGLSVFMPKQTSIFNESTMFEVYVPVAVQQTNYMCLVLETTVM
jgi:hypothetical protein